MRQRKTLNGVWLDAGGRHLRRSALALLVAAAALLVSPPIHAASEPALPKLRVVLRLAIDALPEATLGDRRAVRDQRTAIAIGRTLLAHEMTGRDVRITRGYTSVPFVAAEVSLRELEALARSPWVASIHGDDMLPPALSQSTQIVEAPDVWPMGFDGTGFAVAVLDTGVEGDHEHLSGKVVAEACFSANGSCPNAGTSQVGTGAGAPCEYGAACAHGTHVAGIAAGHGPSLSGVAPGAKVIAIQVFSRFDGAPYCNAGQSCPLAFTSDLIQALEHVYALRGSHDIAAVNMSLGGGYFASQSDCDSSNAGVKAAIDQLRAAGIATIVASGNEGYLDGLGAPGCISSAISVGSTTKSNQVSYFSNAASFLNLMAPGSSIVSSVPGGGYASMSGTSMATPHVAGAWAIMRQADRFADVDTLLSWVRQNGLPIADSAAGITKKLVKLEAATLAAAAPDPQRIRVRSLNRTRRVRGDTDVEIRWKATPGIESVDVAYSMDRGETWIDIQTGVTGSDRITWTTPVLTETQRGCKVRVIAYDGDGLEVARDTNNGRFKIARVSDA